MKKQKTIVNKFTGKWGWFIFWCIMFFPAAVLYYFMKLEKVEVYK